MQNLGIYIQVPFCQTKCTYCNFHTGVVSTARFAPYIKTVCREICGYSQLYRGAGVTLPPSFHDMRVDTVYIGGGTPSLLDPEHLQEILDSIRTTFETDLSEVTLEADPETIEDRKAEVWVRAGVNRVSFGLQSFSDKELVAAGRMHRRADIYRAVPVLRERGIENISFDLIAGLPHQTRASWQQSLHELMKLAPEHVSIYLLEVDEASRLGKELLQGGSRYSAASVPGDDDMAEFYEMAQEALGGAGYHHYEISNWAKPGFESRHNLKYWRRHAYLGFGAGAHSFSGTERWANAHDAAAYVMALEGKRLPLEQHEALNRERALEEELFLGLRELDGIDLQRIEKQYGVTVTARFDPLAKSGLVERQGSRVRLAPARLSISNEVFVELLR
ncbi:MAG TPA: radical SAM family heme chaperone HemW [Candidatus Dormibacteraeota bacterium]|nr:radical SAM family heme chaperone HemW [Candidatus Dormibacteraeota bacterium]